MTPTPPSAATSSSGHSPEEQFRVVRRRNRVPLSCYPCRTRKLKCNRGTPSCENCVKRGDTQSCVYATPSSRRKNQSSAGASSTPDDMQNRIDRLEGLVLSLMHGGANIDVSTASATAPAAPSNTDSSSPHIEREDEGAMRDEVEPDDGDSDVDDGLATSLGVLKVDADKGKSMYIGQEHWHVLLADIAEVKNFYSSHKKELENSYQRVMSSKPATARDSPIFLLSAPPATEVELRAELPSRTAIMTLISRYFNSLDTAASIVHGPTFQQQLRSHWQDPSKSTIMWIGLLYAMLCLAMLSYHKVGDEPPEWKGRSLELAAEYRLRTVQCLVVADYTKPVEYTVETLLLYLFGEYSSRWDADLSLWIITGIITRLAFRMGYHRDADWFPSVTPFQGEMRRRTWALLRMADIVFSYQVSLPTMIYEHDTDTKLPHNIFDEEFGPNSKTLPTSRPMSEPSPIAYMIGKTKLCIEFGSILQAVTRVGKQVSYDEILLHDRRLREIMEEFPPHLKIRSLEGSHDPVTLIIARFNLDILYQKVMCMLHRKHMMRARQHPRYAHSRRSAIEASLQILKHLRTIYRECQPNGRLRSMKWYISATSKDTLLPTMLVVLDLHHDHGPHSKRQGCQAGVFWTPEQRQEMLASLEEVSEIWKSLSHESVEAYKAANILEIMLGKLKNPDTGPAGAGGSSVPPESLFSFGAEMLPEHSAAMTLGMLSGGVTSGIQSPGGTTYPNIDLGLGTGTGTGLTPEFQPDTGGIVNNAASPFSMFTTIGGGGNMAIDNNNFDWDAFENYAQTATWGPDQSSFQFFAGNPDQQSQQESSDGSFTFLNPSTPGS
ncbi:fungal-specific transcription factor domain-containing protein [Annulohypoxylon truncatum]|uniref:fungal-specific transcription factor domain-containing protein n=1 Tax=Annulohypoxylon truncatum TaxID=327061 RepID=UPI002008347D|nr:fungal-specific transcription factor domain-containing protein [Annulohypoxylon truncatum]KAI1209421.1 fungal-specific transcription factor domain-containing protein [Annulohypoxylon truncatum]